MYAERHSITFTTDTNQAATAYTDKDVTGRILQIQYVKSNVAAGSTMTLTGNTTNVPVFTIQSMNASATHIPRRPTTDQDGAAITYDQTATVNDSVVLVRERVKLVVANGGSERNGTFHITVG